MVNPQRMKLKVPVAHDPTNAVRNGIPKEQWDGIVKRHQDSGICRNLPETAQKLANEVSALATFGRGVQEVIGTTNWSVLMHWRDQVHLALEPVAWALMVGDRVIETGDKGDWRPLPGQTIVPLCVATTCEPSEPQEQPVREPDRWRDAVQQVKESELFEDGCAADLHELGIESLTAAYMQGRLDTIAQIETYAGEPRAQEGE